MTTYVYDDQNRMVGLYRPESKKTPQAANTYDAFGRVVTQKLADGTVHKYNYSGWRTERTDQSGRTTAWYFDPDMTVNVPKRVIKYVDDQGRTTTYAYDGHGRMTEKVEPDGTKNKYIHKANGTMIKQVTPPR